MPLVSVIMPVFNANRYLKDAISSILNQSLTDFEFIIIDDGSNDGSTEIINEFSKKDSRIRFFTQKNSGISFTLNKALHLARSNIIARMDADDISHNSRLYDQFNFITNNEQYIVVGSNANVIDEFGKFLGVLNRFESNEDLKNKLPSTPFIHSSVMYRKNIVLKVGGYNEKVSHFFEDKLLWCQVNKFGLFHNLQTPLVSYRITQTSISSLDSDKEKIIENIILFFLKHHYFPSAFNNLLNDINSNKFKKHVTKSNYYYRIAVIFKVNANYKLASYSFFFSWLLSILKIKRLFLSILCLLRYFLKPQ